jgi:hypothetical protein
LKSPKEAFNNADAGHSYGQSKDRLREAARIAEQRNRCVPPGRYGQAGVPILDKIRGAVLSREVHL